MGGQEKHDFSFFIFDGDHIQKALEGGSWYQSNELSIGQLSSPPHSTLSRPDPFSNQLLHTHAKSDPRVTDIRF